MPAPYSTDLRQRVIDAYKANEGSQRQLAKRFKVRLSFVQRLIRRHENTGQVTAKLHAGGARAKITVEGLPIVQQLVNEQPDALLAELCARLQERSGLKVSIPTMHRAVQRLGLTTKKKRALASEQDSPRVCKMRFEYRDWVLGVDPGNLVFVDESGLNLGMTRINGRATRGQRLYDSCPRNQGHNISLIGALSLDGLIATMSIPGSVNTDVFLTYISEVLQ